MHQHFMPFLCTFKDVEAVHSCASEYWIINSSWTEWLWNVKVTVCLSIGSGWLCQLIFLEQGLQWSAASAWGCCDCLWSQHGHISWGVSDALLYLSEEWLSRILISFEHTEIKLFSKCGSSTQSHQKWIWGMFSDMWAHALWFGSVRGCLPSMDVFYLWNRVQPCEIMNMWISFHPSEAKRKLGPSFRAESLWRKI